MTQNEQAQEEARRRDLSYEWSIGTCKTDSPILNEKYMAKKRLWEDVQGSFPPNTAPIVQEAIGEIGSLEASKPWQPSLVNPPDAWKVVDWEYHLCK